MSSRSFKNRNPPASKGWFEIFGRRFAGWKITVGAPKLWEPWKKITWKNSRVHDLPNAIDWT